MDLNVKQDFILSTQTHIILIRLLFVSRIIIIWYTLTTSIQYRGTRLIYSTPMHNVVLRYCCYKKLTKQNETLNAIIIDVEYSRL